MTYDYLLSYFVAQFNYSVDQFDLLTPAQAVAIQDMKADKDREYINLFKVEIRRLAYYIWKSSMADTSSISSPSDLYKLESDEQYEQDEKEYYENLLKDFKYEQWIFDYLANEN